MSLARNLISSGHACIAIATIAASTQPYKRYLISLSCAISLTFSTPSHRSTVPGRTRRASLALPALQYYASSIHSLILALWNRRTARQQTESVSATDTTHSGQYKTGLYIGTCFALLFSFHTTPLDGQTRILARLPERHIALRRRRCWADANIIQSAGEFVNPLKSVGDFVETCALCFHCHMGDCDV